MQFYKKLRSWSTYLYKKLRILLSNQRIFNAFIVRFIMLGSNFGTSFKGKVVFYHIIINIMFSTSKTITEVRGLSVGRDLLS